MVDNDNEDDILARAIGDLGIAVTGKTVAWEEALTVDTHLGGAAEQVHAVLAATKHPLLPSQPATSGDQCQIRWIAGHGGAEGGLSPVLITVSLTSMGTRTHAPRVTSNWHRTVSKERILIEIRGAAMEEGSRKPWSAARTAVDWLMGMLADRFDPYDIVEISG